MISQKQISLSKESDKKIKSDKRKYNRSYKLTWGGRPYKSKKKDGFFNKRDDIRIVNGVWVLEGNIKKVVKKGKKKVKEIALSNDDKKKLLHIDGTKAVFDETDEPILSLDESVATFDSHHSMPTGTQNFDGTPTGIYLIAPSMKTSYDCIKFFVHHSGTTFTPISGMGYLYRNMNPFQTILPKIAMRDPLTFKMVDEFAKITKATHILRKNRIKNSISGCSSSESNSRYNEGWSLSSKSNNLQDLDIESYAGISNDENELIDTNEGKFFNDLWLEKNGYDEFYEERQIVKNFKDVYKKFEVDALKKGAYILIQSKIVSDEPINKNEIVNVLTSLLMLQVFYAYFGKHNKNVKLIVGTCKELLYLLRKINDLKNQQQITVEDSNGNNKILIASEHTFKNHKHFIYDDHNFFNSVTKTQQAKESYQQMNDEREIQFLSNWTNYNDILTAMTFIPEKKALIPDKNKTLPNFFHLSLKKDHYTYKIDDNKRSENMNELKDIEYFSGVDLQNIKYMNELTDLLFIKDEIDDLESDIDPLMILNFENQCMKLSVNMENYLNTSEAERDVMMYEKKQGLLGLNAKLWTNNNITTGALQEYEQLRTVNKIFALISILQVHRRLLNRLTEDNHVKGILLEIIKLLENHVPLASAAAQCLFGSMFIVGCELGNLFIDKSNTDIESLTLKKGKQIIMSHFDSLLSRGLIAAERAKDVIHHIWLTNSLNSTYKNWWVILKESDINIHLSL
ncbi:hypothetical protein DAHU10_023120 [Hanseniaspora uvarum]|nr:hypothetical protein DAHU10_023120 [Hanseniaspora uvarum]